MNATATPKQYQATKAALLAKYSKYDVMDVWMHQGYVSIQLEVTPEQLSDFADAKHNVTKFGFDGIGNVTSYMVSIWVKAA